MRTESRVEGANGRGDDRMAIVSSAGATMIVVADGAGGMAGAAEAAEHVTQFSWTSANALQGLKFIDLQLSMQSGSGESTGVVLSITQDVIQGASCGDSEAWLVTANKCYLLTEAQHRKPLLGSGKAQPTAFNAPLTRECLRLLVATDGLFDFVDHSKIVAVLRRKQLLSEVTTELVDLARLSNGRLQDDVAVVVVERGTQTEAQAR